MKFPSMIGILILAGGLAPLGQAAQAAEKQKRHFSCPPFKTYSYGEHVTVTNTDGSKTKWRAWIQQGDKAKAVRWTSADAKPVFGHPDGKDETELNCTQWRVGGTDLPHMSLHVRVPGKWRCFHQRPFGRGEPDELWCETY